MNDNEIIKALECCDKDDILDANNNVCLECPMNDDHVCTFNLRKYVLDFIKRQRAEIEKKRQTIKELVAARKDWEILAIKEFAERLKENIVVYEGRYGELAEVVDVDCIDDLVKEMAGEINGK